MNLTARLPREPLLLFVLGGALLAGLWTWTRPEPLAATSSRTIVVTDADVGWLIEVFQKTRMRPPTVEELTGMVRQRVREERLFREAVALGLDREDPVQRRRLAMKLDYLVRDAAAQVDPTQAELASWLDAHRSRYVRGPWRAFTQVYLSRDRHGEETEAHAATLLERLQTEPGLDPATVGDPSLLEGQVPPSSEAEVARTFGSEFAAAVFGLEVGSWQGPVPSGLGVHLVRVDQVVPASSPRLENVEAEVRNDLLDARRQAAVDAYHAQLREKYPAEIRADIPGLRIEEP